MLIDKYTFEIKRPECNTSLETLNAIAELPCDISGALPYIASIVKPCDYDDANKTLVFIRDGKKVVLSAQRIAVAILVDQSEAEKFLEEIKNLINDTYKNRENITPLSGSTKKVRSLDIFKLLPGENCKKCGETTCLAFAAKLAMREAEPALCTTLFDDKYRDRRKGLKALLLPCGYKFPEEGN